MSNRSFSNILFKCSNLCSLQQLINSGENLNVSDSTGNTLLHNFCLSFDNHIRIKMLLDGKADPNVANCDLHTPLHLIMFKASSIPSCQMKNLTCTKILLGAGAKCHTKDIHGKSALDYALNDMDRTPAHKYLIQFTKRTKQRLLPFMFPQDTNYYPLHLPIDIVQHVITPFIQKKSNISDRSWNYFRNGSIP